MKNSIKYILTKIKRFVKEKIIYFIYLINLDILILKDKHIISKSSKGPGRAVTIKKEDIFITSYPKSGNTWLRFLLANIINDKNVDFSNIEKIIPDIYRNKDSNLLKMPAPRILKSHEYFDPKYPKTVYIVRDPLDVALSLFYFMKKLDVLCNDSSEEEYVMRLLTGEFNGTFGSWADNVGSWYGASKGSKKILIIKYEELISNTEHELKKVLKFLNIKYTKDQLQKAIKNSSFKKMSLLENKTNKFWLGKKMRADYKFVRSGKINEGKEFFSDKSIKKLTLECRELMKIYGYI